MSTYATLAAFPHLASESRTEEYSTDQTTAALAHDSLIYHQQQQQQHYHHHHHSNNQQQQTPYSRHGNTVTFSDYLVSSASSSPAQAHTTGSYHRRHGLLDSSTDAGCPVSGGNMLPDAVCCVQQQQQQSLRLHQGSMDVDERDSGPQLLLDPYSYGGSSAGGGGVTYVLTSGPLSPATVGPMITGDGNGSANLTVIQEQDEHP